MPATNTAIAKPARLTQSGHREKLRLPVSGATDPIFAKMQEHKEACRLRSKALKGGCSDEESYALCDAEWDIWRDMLKVRPTTVAGVTAFAAYGYRHALDSGSDETAPEVLKLVAEALKRLAPAH